MIFDFTSDLAITPSVFTVDTDTKSFVERDGVGDPTTHSLAAFAATEALDLGVSLETHPAAKTVVYAPVGPIVPGDSPDEEAVKCSCCGKVFGDNDTVHQYGGYIYCDTCWKLYFPSEK